MWNDESSPCAENSYILTGCSDNVGKLLDCPMDDTGLRKCKLIFNYLIESRRALTEESLFQKECSLDV